jgi:hypothetical protein
MILVHNRHIKECVRLANKYRFRLSNYLQGTEYWPISRPDVFFFMAEERIKGMFETPNCRSLYLWLDNYEGKPEYTPIEFVEPMIKLMLL